tara:strand:- start:1344 stop:2615 length:1272 start_codon:yes stop_codon:yes gene_type:complete
MTISRMGISSLMGFENGGDATSVSGIQVLNDPQVQNLIDKMLKEQDDNDSVSMQFKQYSDMLSQITPPRPQPTGFDLASALGRGILTEQKSKFPTIGRGLSLGFQEFSKLQKEIDEENRKNKQARDLTAFGLVTKKKADPNAKIGALWKDPDGNFFRELIIGDEIVYKGEGQVMSEADFNLKFPNARPTVASEEQRYNMTIDNFFKYEKEMREQEQSLDKLINYMRTLRATPQGYELMATRAQNAIKTFLADENITPEELALGLAEGKFQGLIGRFRVETVGPGVMTEFDAERIIAALGGEPGALQNKFRAAAIMKDIFENKLVLYEDAAKKYNAGVASGEFDSNIYKPHKIRDDFDMSVFEFPLSAPPGAELIEEIKDKNDNEKVVAIIYEYNGKRFKKFINGTITEIKPETKDDNEIELPE